MELVPGGLGTFTYSPPSPEDLETLDPMPWVKAMTARKYKRLGDTYAEAVNLISSVDTQPWAEKWKLSLHSDKPFPHFDLFEGSTFDGKPALFVFAYILALPSWADYNTHYNRLLLKGEYGRLTGKTLGNDMVPTVCWWCGKSFSHRTFSTIANSPSVAQEAPSTGPIEERLNDIEDMLLEAMSAIAELKSHRGNGDLYSTLKDLQDLGAKVTIEVGSSET